MVWQLEHIGYRAEVLGTRFHVHIPVVTMILSKPTTKGKIVKITDQNVIRSRIENAEDFNDGLTVFIKQGAYIVDMCAHSGEEVIYGECGEYKRQYNMFEITIAKRREEFHQYDSFMNYSYMKNVNVVEEFDLSNATYEYYDSER